MKWGIWLSGLLAIALVVPTTPTTTAAQEAPEQPNILIILTDDQRAPGTMKVMKETRRLFGSGGTRYSNAVVTTPLCCPSRASILTGQYAHNHGVHTNPDGDNLNPQHTMPKELKEAGYLTAITGKYLNTWRAPPAFFDRWATFSGQRAYYEVRFDVNGTLQETDEYSTDFIAEKTVEFLRDFESYDDRPWLMYVAPNAPHSPAIYEPEYELARLPKWRTNPAVEENNLRDKPQWVHDSAEISMRDVKRLREDQLRTLLSVDELVARTFAEIDELDEEGNTLAFFLSDNGWTWGEHGLQGKDAPYNESVKVPFYVRWPGHVEPGTDDRIVANIDIAPTIYEATGVLPDYLVDGKSIFTSDRDYAYLEFYETPRENVPSWHSLWYPDSTYIRYKDTGEREAYYPSDPWQLRNLYGDTIEGNEPADEPFFDGLLEAGASCVGILCP